MFAELAGYVLHRLLHSESISFLSRSHMIHHLVTYGPRMKQRPGNEYRSAVTGRASVVGIGMEWIVPIVVMLIVVHTVFWLTGAGVPYQILFTMIVLAWGYLLFGYIHDAMHKKDFWMLKNRFFRRWFLNARRNHDIHHIYVNPEGKMSKNFGICFFWFDRLFRTYQTKARRVNQENLQKALDRYAIRETEA